MSDHKLSAEQEAAVRSNDPAIVVVASAGSGKTEVVAQRVERLLIESPSDSFRVLALSYTLKAAEELARRFRERLGDLHRRVDTNTVHGFAHLLLRQHGTRIGLPAEPEVLVRDEDRAELLARWLRDEGRDVPADLANLFQELDVARARQHDVPLLTEWEAALASVGAVDYGSMLLKATELLELPSGRRQLSRLYAYVIVDEAQNLTASQFRLLRTLIGPPDASNHLPTMVVGDEKQSIVSFAGADPRLIRRFETEYSATRFDLHQNFRSAGRIVALAGRVAEALGARPLAEGQAVDYAAPGLVLTCDAPDEPGEGRMVADWVSRLLDEGLPPEALAPNESRYVRPDEIAVLGRSAAALRETRAALNLAGHSPAMSSSPSEWLSTLTGKTALELIALQSAAAHQSTHWQLARLVGADENAVATPQGLAEVLATHTDGGLQALAPLCSLATPNEFMTALAQLNVPDLSVDPGLANWEADCQQLEDAWQQFIEQTDRVEQTWGNLRLYVSRLQRGDDLAPGVRLLTIHKSQGREYRAVAVVALNDGQLPDFRAANKEERESELRAFYVAVTRPSRVLLLSRARSRQTRYGARASDPSPFLRLLASRI